MAEQPRIDVFGEDRAHEQFARALILRLAREVGLRPRIHAVSARGGEGRAITEFSAWQRGFLQSRQQGTPELVVLLIDANCKGWHEVRRELEQSVDTSIVPRSVLGCPDPHIERWFLADPVGFAAVVGAPPQPDRGKCERALYKRLVEEAARQASLPLITGIADLAPDLVDAMDLYRAGQAQPSLRHFVDELKGALRLLAG